MDAVLPDPSFGLEPPDTYVFTVADAVRGRVLNRFAASLKSASRRAEFAADPAGVLAAEGITGDHAAMVLARDWTGLVRAGAHLQLLLFVAAPLGHTLWDIGADHVGCRAEQLIEACPRVVHGLPPTMPRVAVEGR
jgi:protocatechuate 4,5-dioxygenase, alpha chain